MPTATVIELCGALARALGISDQQDDGQTAAELSAAATPPDPKHWQKILLELDPDALGSPA